MLVEVRDALDHAHQPPFDGDDPLAVLYSHLHDPVPEPPFETADARRVYAVIASMLAKDPAERIGSAAELRAALGGAPAIVDR